jgi:hypothetical protein
MDGGAWGDALGLCSLAGAGGALILEAEWLERHAGDGRETRSTRDPETGRPETNGRYNPGVLFVVVLKKGVSAASAFTEVAVNRWTFSLDCRRL